MDHRKLALNSTRMEYGGNFYQYTIPSYFAGVRVTPTLRELDQNKQRRRMFHKSIRCTMLTCRMAGMLPLAGLWNHTSDTVRFEWKSLYTVVYVLGLLGNFVRFILYIFHNMHHEPSLRRASNSVFCASTVISSFLVLHLSVKWRKMVLSIEDIEDLMPPITNPRSVVRFANICTAVVLTLAAVEHTLYVVYTYDTALDCFILPEDSGLYIKSYCMALNGWLYDYVSFSYTIGILVQLSAAQATFVWNFVDMIIMSFSIYLIAQFKSFNDTLLGDKLMHALHSGLSWSQIQVNHTRLTKLVKVVDDHINPMVFLSFSTNLFFICQQLFYLINKSFRKDISDDEACNSSVSADTITTIYLSYSFLFIVLRLLLVSLLAAQVNKISCDSLAQVHSAPTPLYNMELQRFMNQVGHGKVALSGMNFFYVTRGLILSVAATIVTYELVLLQIQPRKP